MSWLAQKERGSVLLLRCILWISLSIGRPLSRALLYVICSYYLLFFTSQTFKASKDYLSIMLGKPARWWHVYKHYHVFSSNILDRVYFLKDKFAGYDIRITGKELIDDKVAKHQGCILLGSHLGSFECARALGRKLPGLRVRFLMYEKNSQKMSTLLNVLNPQVAQDIIDLHSSDAILKVQEVLEKGEMVAILGDRTTHGSKMVECDFLGRKALFPTGPLLMASILKVPVILFFSLYQGNKCYDVYFETLAETIEIQRETRYEDIALWVQRYADRLAHYCQQSPYSWFNFYDFWAKDDA